MALTATSKLKRLRLPDGRPLAIQTDNKTPRIWMLPEHEGSTPFVSASSVRLNASM